LAGDEAAFQERTDDLLVLYRENWPDPTERLITILRWNTWKGPYSWPWEVMVSMYDAESAVETASLASEPPPAFLSEPGFEAKLQLARGRQMSTQGRPEEAIALLRGGVEWFRDRGDEQTFPYYFLGAELLAVALAGQGDLQAAYGVLEDAAEQRNLVVPYTAPLHQRIQARLALLSRELGRTAEAEAVEAELEEALSLADQDHPILVQIREQRDAFLEIE
jgi:tetratricopeptide (TPR) repeat protein